MSPETEQLRHELADRFDAHPASEWSANLIRAVTAVLDLYMAEEAQMTPEPEALRSIMRDVRPQDLAPDELAAVIALLQPARDRRMR